MVSPILENAGTEAYLASPSKTFGDGLERIHTFVASELERLGIPQSTQESA